MNDKSSGKNFRPVQMRTDVHAGLTRLAAERTQAEGRRVTLRQLVEDAVRAQYPELSGVGDALPARRSDALDEQIFGQLVMAALESDPAEGARAIEGLTGTVPGSFGQALRLRDLAYYLRSAMDAQSAESGVGSLGELIAAYEGQ